MMDDKQIAAMVEKLRAFAPPSRYESANLIEAQAASPPAETLAELYDAVDATTGGIEYAI